MAHKGMIFLSSQKPYDVSKWSGTIYHIYTALVKNDGDIAVVPVNCGALDFLARLLNKLLRVMRVKLDCRFSTLFAVLAGCVLTVKLSSVRANSIVTIASSNLIPYIFTRKKIIYISDGTFRSISASYPDFQAFPKWLKRQGDRNEAKALCKAQYIIYPSRWAVESARSDYGVPKAKIFELPFGPNFPDALLSQADSSKSVNLAGEVRILFVSADWKRKNGDKAIQICQLLIGAGVNVRLVTVGDTPKFVKELSFVTDKGFLRKSDPAQLLELCRVYREAHFFLLPSDADASPIVLSEAQAFGVPPLACNTGGTGSSVIHEQTGLLLPPGAKAEIFAEEIMRCLRHPEFYAQLSMQCRKWYVENANWQNWSKLILKLAADAPPAPP
jgi:glycosyltransferase involved in cell wall biosynthesis